MGTLLINTTSLWNCGDDFIRKGLLDLMQLRSYTKTLWWNRGYGITDSFANDLDINLQAADYILIAGTPEWIDKTERLYLHSLRHGTPLSLVGVGLKGCIRNASQRKLLERIANSGLVEVCMARDRIALDFLHSLGFKEVELILDPAFFMNPLPKKDANNILCWRDISRNNPKLLRHFMAWIRWTLKGRVACEQWAHMYNRLMQDIFSAMPDPKLVVVHDNREIKTAEQLFGKEHIFYSIDYLEMLKVYSTATQYVGTRIHGAIAAAIHGAPIHLIYPNKKAIVIEDSVKLLNRYFHDINKSIKVDYLTDKQMDLDTINERPSLNNAFYNALQQEREKVRSKLKRATKLGTYME
ncbi:polysaccharide pyruvyl transferase family protein [Candidatus Latescibacterota bacterium]